MATHEEPEGAVPTWRPKRDNCTPPAIEQFPRPLMSKWLRQHGGLVIHVLVAVFTFFGLAIVCDEYFVASLDRLCEGKIFFNVSSFNYLLLILFFFFVAIRRIKIVTGCSGCYIYGCWQFSS